MLADVRGSLRHDTQSRHEHVVYYLLYDAGLVRHSRSWRRRWRRLRRGRRNRARSRRRHRFRRRWRNKHRRRYRLGRRWRRRRCGFRNKARRSNNNLWRRRRYIRSWSRCLDWRRGLCREKSHEPHQARPYRQKEYQPNNVQKYKRRPGRNGPQAVHQKERVPCAAGKTRQCVAPAGHSIASEKSP